MKTPNQTHRHLRSTRLLGTLALLAVPFACQDQDEQVTGSVTHEASVHATLSGSPTRADVHERGISAPGYFVVGNDTIIQHVTLPSAKQLSVHTTDFSVTPEAKSVFTYTASFDIDSVAARTQDDLFVTGIARNGDVVIERWEIAEQTGALRVQIGTSGPAPALGVPSPAPTTSTSVPGGLPYVPLDQRAVGQPSLTRTELVRTQDIDPIRDNSMAADPEGRFLLFLTEDSVLYQLDLSDPNALPIPIHDASSLWTLDHIQAMARLQVAGMGRVWDLGPPQVLPDPTSGGLVRHVLTLLYDADNDGLFEQAVVHDIDTDLLPISFFDLIESDFLFEWQ